MICDWLIVGGGIHGVHIAARLLSDAGVAPEQLLIVDPGERLLERWRDCTQITGMRHLRSPSVHHLDLDPWALQRFAGKKKNRKRGLFAPPYDRPALKLFNAHCDRVISDLQLDDLHLRARVVDLRLDCDSVKATLSTGEEVEALHVVLALGAAEHTERPHWAPQGDPRVQHIFEPGFDGWPTKRETVAVVGGGISAGQVAIRLSKEGHDVHLVSRHSLRKHQFDSDPGWLGPKFMESFDRERDVDRRRELITVARHRGSVPEDVARNLRRAIKAEKVNWHEDEVAHLDPEDTSLKLHLRSGGVFQVERVLLATGFRPSRPGGSLIDNLAGAASLPCASCGYPIVDKALRWHPRVYVSGPLAELELGPAARNIAGARRAAERMVQAARGNMESFAPRP